LSTISIQKGTKMVLGPEIPTGAVRLRLVVRYKHMFKIVLVLKPDKAVLGKTNAAFIQKFNKDSATPLGVVKFYELVQRVIVHCRAGVPPLFIVMGSGVSMKTIKMIEHMVELRKKVH